MTWQVNNTNFSKPETLFQIITLSFLESTNGTDKIENGDMVTCQIHALNTLLSVKSLLRTWSDSRIHALIGELHARMTSYVFCLEHALFSHHKCKDTDPSWHC